MSQARRRRRHPRVADAVGRPASGRNAETRHDIVPGARLSVSFSRTPKARRRCPGRTCPASAPLTAILTAAREAGTRAAAQALADAAAGGCAHTRASAAYQVPARLRELVNSRDLMCTFPTCRQPAWRCDTDHTQPFDQGGPT
jgi:hypothetical protein